MNGRVVAAFPATGKSYLAARLGDSAVDSDSSQFARGNGEWPRNYIGRITADFDAGRTVLVSTHAEVRAALVAAGVYFVLAYPQRGLRAEYRERMKRRDSDGLLIDKVIGMWDRAIGELDAQEGCDRLILGSGRFLSDVFSLPPDRDGGAGG